MAKFKREFAKCYLNSKLNFREASNKTAISPEFISIKSTLDPNEKGGKNTGVKDGSLDFKCVYLESTSGVERRGLKIPELELGKQ